MPEYKHKEAFCLMTYKCKECNHTEIIWNSRDGVTPFGCRCPSCGDSMYHTNFYEDRCVRNYKLNLFQKFWRDGTVEEAVNIVKSRLDSANGTKYERTPEDKKRMLEEVRNQACKVQKEFCSWHEFQKGWPMLDINIQK